MLDLTLQILSNKHRRRLLTELMNSHKSNAVCVPEEVVDTEHALEDVHSELCHRHLPLLEEAQLVRWNTNSHTVERGAKFDDVCPLLDLLTAHQQTLPGEWI